ncbi:alpha-ribazole phosphatase family protein [Methylomarinum sp. Ch1-1]|uniref:Alpha-ribazole phosphatase family protein n=1 Tax=Methylomarinum roseum TaxID=3067653 RepID=A0AAU7NX88_9GAMM|nr:alpha-ribazole phosphatase family protein [Methylomarinum sp. Ch1-1]MDP4522238.1 alpha-ribazole phosphatase family protein [Methylomarinum sp. Ch1-1]
MKTTTIDLLRHGEALGGACYRGRTDDPLTPLGWRQMQRQTADQCWDRIISSPLARCHDFAKQLAKQKNLPLHVDARWQEIDFGDWDGKTAAQIEQRSPAALTRYYADPCGNTPPHGEKHADFSRRVDRAWQALLSRYPEQHLLVVTHAGVIRTLLSQLLGIPFRQSFQIGIGHACLSRLNCYHQTSDTYTQLILHKPL